MLQKIDKKKYIFFYLVIFLILSSIHNTNFESKNFFSINKIDVVGLNKSNNLLLENKLVDLIGYNIFTLEKESFKFINSLNFIKDYNIKKIYPNQLIVNLEPAKAISVVKYLDKFVILGNNGKIIHLDRIPINIPIVTGTNDIKKVFQTLEMIDKSNFNVENIKEIEFFLSDRIDIEFKNKKKIRFPINYTIDDFNFALSLLNDDEYSKSKILDLRIPSRLITYE